MGQGHFGMGQSMKMVQEGYLDRMSYPKGGKSGVAWLQVSA